MSVKQKLNVIAYDQFLMVSKENYFISKVKHGGDVNVMF